MAEALPRHQRERARLRPQRAVDSQRLAQLDATHLSTGSGPRRPASHDAPSRPARQLREPPDLRRDERRRGRPTARPLPRGLPAPLRRRLRRVLDRGSRQRRARNPRRKNPHSPFPLSSLDRNRPHKQQEIPPVLHESRRGDSNPGPPPYHGGALPAELRRQQRESYCGCEARPARLNPPAHRRVLTVLARRTTGRARSHIGRQTRRRSMARACRFARNVYITVS